MAVKIVLRGETIAMQCRRNMSKNQSDMARAMTLGARDAGFAILTQGRQNISGAGRFGSRWTQGLKADVEPKSGALLNPKITISHDIPYFGVFEKGATIHGNPMLWIPLSYTNLRVSASQYASVAGGLFSGKSRSGLPLLFSRTTKEPVYFGISSVTIPKKFSITEICIKVARDFDRYYSAHMPKSGKK